MGKYNHYKPKKIVNCNSVTVELPTNEMDNEYSNLQTTFYEINILCKIRSQNVLKKYVTIIIDVGIYILKLYFLLIPNVMRSGPLYKA